MVCHGYCRKTITRASKDPRHSCCSIADMCQTLVNEPSVADWRQMVRGEFQEIPGLHLTQRQAQRLWGLDAATCEALLDSLVQEHFLRRTSSDQYARA